MPVCSKKQTLAFVMLLAQSAKCRGFGGSAPKAEEQEQDKSTVFTTSRPVAFPQFPG